LKGGEMLHLGWIAVVVLAAWRVGYEVLKRRRSS
jgi:hypothetical protein